MTRLELSVMFAWLAATAYTTRAQGTPAEAAKELRLTPDSPMEWISTRAAVPLQRNCGARAIRIQDGIGAIPPSVQSCRKHATS